MSHQKFLKKFKIKCYKKYRASHIQISGYPFSVRFTVENNLSKRNRRQLLLAFHEIIVPHLEQIHGSCIHHDDHLFGADLSKIKDVSLLQGIDLSMPDRELGYFIRGIRTKLGKTQKQFANEMEVHSTYLSKIEKGYRLPGKKLLQKIMSLNSLGKN